MHFWVIDDDSAKAVLITDRPYQAEQWNEFRPLLESADAQLIHEPLVAVLEEMVTQLDQPLLRTGFRAAAEHVRVAIAELRKAHAEIRTA